MSRIKLEDTAVIEEEVSSGWMTREELQGWLRLDSKATMAEFLKQGLFQWMPDEDLWRLEPKRKGKFVRWGEPMMTPNEAEAMLECSRQWLNKLRTRSRIPYVKLGERVVRMPRRRVMEFKLTRDEQRTASQGV